MENKGLSWKFYAEQYPADKCFTGDKSGNYVRRHLPILSFVKVQKDPTLCSKVVPATQLAPDLAGNNQPDYSFYVPDLKNDGHDTSVAYASNWLEGLMNSLTANPEFVSQTLVIVTFDESRSYSNNHIYTVLLGPNVKPGSTSDAPYNHYNLLKTIEETFSLGNLGREDSGAAPFTGIWQAGIH